MITKIVFGMALDGVRNPERDLLPGQAAINKVVCGPMSLLQLMETRLGFCGVEANASERIGFYLRKARAADAAWCRGSLAKDPWGTASRLLALRDELVMMGWQPADCKQGSDTRIGALSLIEQTHIEGQEGGTELLGLADRLWRVARCPHDLGIGIQIAFSDDPESYPAVWKAIFKRHFPNCVGEHESKSVVDEHRRPQLSIVRAPDEIRLAVELSRYLKAGTDADNREIAIVAEGDTTLLDGVLTRYGLPRVGRSTSSVYREVLEVVPLWLELMWKPFRPELLLSLLGMSVGPMSRAKARHLIRALNEAPGIGGEAWNKAWEEIFKMIEEAKEWKDGICTDKPLSPREKTAKRNEAIEWKRILEEDRFSIEDGIPAPRLLAVMRHIRKRLSAKRGELMKENRESAESNERVVGLSVAIEHVDMLVDIAKTYGDSCISRPQLSRIAESIIGRGLGRYDAHEEVAQYSMVRNPGQLLKPVKTAIWWDFTDPGFSRRTNWLESELAGLPGCYDAVQERYREVEKWKQAYMMVTEHLVCFIPERKSGDATVPHPFYDNLVMDYGGEDAVKKLTQFVNAPTAAEERALAGRTWALHSADPAFEPVRESSAVIPTNAAMTVGKMSPSQLETLVECPYRWYLKYHVGLKDADLNDVLNDSLVKGKLAHKVMELLFTEIKPATPESASVAAGVLFERLVPEMAAMYDAVDKREARQFFKKTLCDSVAAFFREIEKRNLEFEACELDLPMVSIEDERPDGKRDKDKDTVGKRFRDTVMAGRLDLVLHDKVDHSKKFIVDYKWSKHPEKYKQAIASGKSIQLAVYDWLLSDGAFGFPSGYYLFPKEELYENGQNPAKRKQDDFVTFVKAEAFFAQILGEIRAGKVRKGVPEKVFEKFPKKVREEERKKYLTDAGIDESVVLDKAAECAFCPFRTLCGDVVQIEPPAAPAEGDVQ